MGVMYVCFIIQVLISFFCKQMSMLVELMAMAHKVDQIDPLPVKNTDDFISALCCALVREGCAIKDIVLMVPLDT
jgi:hypothetical protein